MHVYVFSPLLSHLKSFNPLVSGARIMSEHYGWRCGSCGFRFLDGDNRILCTTCMGEFQRGFAARARPSCAPEFAQAVPPNRRGSSTNEARAIGESLGAAQAGSSTAVNRIAEALHEQGINLGSLLDGAWPLFEGGRERQSSRSREPRRDGAASRSRPRNLGEVGDSDRYYQPPPDDRDPQDFFRARIRDLRRRDLRHLIRACHNELRAREFRVRPR